jgi:hypothetical protein
MEEFSHSVLSHHPVCQFCKNAISPAASDAAGNAGRFYMMSVKSMTQQISVVGFYSSYLQVGLICKQERNGPFQDSEL